MPQEREQRARVLFSTRVCTRARATERERERESEGGGEVAGGGEAIMKFITVARRGSASSVPSSQAMSSLSLLLS